MKEYSEQELYSGQHISELFDSLIGALYEQRVRQRRLYEFKATRRPPRPSQVFEDVNALAEYNKRKASYEQELEAITDYKEAADETVAQLESDVKSVLPINSAVMHTYGGKEADLQGRYVIRYERSPNDLRARPGELPGLIRVQRTTGV